MKTCIVNRFEVRAEWILAALGNRYAFLAAFAGVALWAITGPLFGFSGTWQRVINTGTTITTFLMVFLLQNTGNRTISELQDHLRRLKRQNAQILRAIERVEDADGRNRQAA